MHIGNRLTPDTPVSELYGVGKIRAEKLYKIGICTVRDLIYYFPRGYENRGDVRLLGEYDTEYSHSYILTVATEVTSAKLRGNLTISKFRAFDESGSCDIVFFNSAFVKDIFHVGSTFRFYGRIAFSKSRRITLTAPKYEPVIEGVALDEFLPIYPLTEGITSKFLDGLIKKAINDVLPFLIDPMPEDVRLENDLLTLSEAIRQIHFPLDNDKLVSAIKRLAFDELLYFALGVTLRSKDREFIEGVRFTPCSLKPFTDIFPFELTNSQKDVINDIYRDTVIKKVDGITPSMARIVVGDVGSGKTLCAEAAMYIAHMSGYQSALMAPTEILAEQHYNDIKGHFESLGIKVELLVGSISQTKKKKIYSAVQNGDVDIIVGTHAILSDKLVFNNLGMIITDEQHRFGVRQRAILKDRVKNAHMLVMSATPIPRSLALALYGDLDISRIQEMPKGRMKVDTYVVTEEYRTRLNAFIKKQVELGGQCYIVCPSIEGDNDELRGEHILSEEGLSKSGTLPLKNVKDYTEELKAALPSLRIDSLNGKMKSEEKDEVMRKFSSRETDVLVCTTVIEVGVNVPNASLMVVENAERFGLSQLHQLRGRVGRGTRKSYCVLVSDIKSEKATSRLEIMKTTYDGYEIADKDLVLRGPGDFFYSYSDDNIRQSGGFEFRFASLSRDYELMKTAFSTAKAIVSLDPELKKAENKALGDEIKRLLTPSSTIS